MTPRQIELVRTTFRDIAPMAREAAALFYDRLFATDPSLRRLFRGNMVTQGAKLMQVLEAAIDRLDRIDTLVPVLRDLGRRHAGYGVVDGHYDTVGDAFLWTLEQSLGAGFTPEVREAWATAYGLLAGAMQAGAAVRATA